MTAYPRPGSDADGPTPKQLRSGRYVSPTHSVAMDVSEVTDLAATCAAIQLALPDEAVFSHLTSASLRGWRLPSVARIPIVANTSELGTHLERRGVYVRRSAIPSRMREEWDGVRLASAEWTIVDLAEDLSLIDLVGVIDGALHRRETSIERLAAALVPGRRGARTLREALPLADARSESWWETVLRLAHQLCDIPVESQVEIFDSRGAFVARSDLHIIGTHRYPEYDGADHRDRARHQRDLWRDKAMARIGRERYGYVARELVSTPMLVVRDAEDALGWPHETQRARRWLEELQRSSISRGGWLRLNARLKRFDRLTSPRSRRVVQE